MSTLQEYKEVVSEFGLHTFIPKLAAEINLTESIILQQIYYWLQRSAHKIEGNLWIYNTFEQWYQQFSYMSLSTIKRGFYSLEKQGFIISKKMNARKSNHTKWYALNYKKLIGLLVKLKVQNDFGISQEQQTEFQNREEVIPAEDLKIKNFPLCQNELSLVQNESIYLTKNNLHKNRFISNETNLTTEISEVGRKNIEKQKKLFIKKERKNSITPTKETTSTITESEKTICDKMIDTWNKTFVKEGFKTTYTDKRAKRFLELWYGIIEQNIENWKDFCLKINSSQFLMGEKVKSFKAYCDWVLKEEIVRRIMAGEFGIGDRVPEIIAEAKKIAAEEYRVKRLYEQQELRKKEEKEKEIRSLSSKLRRAAIDKIISNWNTDKRQTNTHYQTLPMIKKSPFSIMQMSLFLIKGQRLKRSSPSIVTLFATNHDAFLSIHLFVLLISQSCLSDPSF